MPHRSKQDLNKKKHNNRLKVSKIAFTLMPYFSEIITSTVTDWSGCKSATRLLNFLLDSNPCFASLQFPYWYFNICSYIIHRSTFVTCGMVIPIGIAFLFSFTSETDQIYWLYYHIIYNCGLATIVFNPLREI